MKKLLLTPFLSFFFFAVAMKSEAQWNLTGNANATVTSILGTTNAIPLNLTTNNIQRMVIDANGKVGIGIAAPPNVFSVKGSGGVPSAVWTNAGAPLFTGFGEQTVGNADYILSIASSLANARPVFIGRRARGTLATPTVVSNNDQIMSFLSSGYDGTGFQNPAAIDFFVDGTPTAGNIPARISFVTGTNGSNRAERLKIGNTGNIAFNTNQLFVEKATGNVGVGTISPTAKLEVNGQVKITGGTPAAGSILTSDATGLATWAAPTSSPWTVSGNDIYNNNVGNVGIGTATPAARLDVSGDALINTVTVGQGGGNVAGNTVVGYQSLLGNSIGLYNTAHGYQTLFSNTTGSFNNATGYQAMYFNTDGINNTANGGQALFSNTLGNDNTAMGFGSLALNTSGYSNVALGTLALYSNTYAHNLVAVGDSALYNNGSGATASYEGGNNVAVGSKALYANTIGFNNTANGYHALQANTIGHDNTANGTFALGVNATGSWNTASGEASLSGNIDGYQNTAFGQESLDRNTSGYENTASGASAMFFNTTGYLNTAYGYRALNNNTFGMNNTASGAKAMYSNTTGYSNVAMGVSALFSNTAQHNLVAVGDSALYNNGNGVTTSYEGGNNVAVGSKALYANTTGYNNTANGHLALKANTTGHDNTANGTFALYVNTSGSWNTANGEGALSGNIDGYENTATGMGVLVRNTSGYENTATGSSALFFNTTGYYNTADGYRGLYNNTLGAYNVATGFKALSINTIGNYNTANGPNAGPATNALSNTTALGSDASTTADNQVRIGNGFVTSIGGFANWTNVSDGRVKKNIKENVPGLAFINKLKPVTYNLNLDAADRIVQKPLVKDKDGKTLASSPFEMNARTAKENILYSGFIAQDVEKAAQSLHYEFSGVDAAKNDKDLYGLRYAEFVVPLVKAVQELSIKNEELKIKNEKQTDTNTALQKQIDDLKAIVTKLVNDRSTAPCPPLAGQ